MQQPECGPMLNERGSRRYPRAGLRLTWPPAVPGRMPRRGQNLMPPPAGRARTRQRRVCAGLWRMAANAAPHGSHERRVPCVQRRRCHRFSDAHPHIDRTPEPPAEEVVAPGAGAKHADRDLVPGQQAGRGVARATLALWRAGCGFVAYTWSSPLPILSGFFRPPQSRAVDRARSFHCGTKSSKIPRVFQSLSLT